MSTKYFLQIIMITIINEHKIFFTNSYDYDNKWTKNIYDYNNKWTQNIFYK